MTLIVIRKILVANRGEIAIRVLRAANELGLRTVAVYADEDKLSLHRFKADESYRVGEGLGPVKAYLSIGEMVRVAREAGCDAVHPGYGFLSESAEFAAAAAHAGLEWCGPRADTIAKLGDKTQARALAVELGIPVAAATPTQCNNAAEVRAAMAAANLTVPVMLKAVAGGGGKGMRPVLNDADLDAAVSVLKVQPQPT